MVVSVIPKLFNKHLFDEKQKKRLELIYNNSFKNGFGVNLYDEQFDDAYKEYTTFTHISNNYHRDTLRHQTDKLQKERIAKNENKQQIACDGQSELKHCLFIQHIINSLKSNKKSNKSINSKHESKLSASYDHIIRCHHFFESKENKMRLSNYIRNETNNGKYCQYGSQCMMMLEHLNTKREDIQNHGGIDSLYSFLENNDYIKKRKIIKLKSYYKDNDYDSDAIRDDLKGSIVECNAMKQIFDIRMMKLIEKHMKIPEPDKNGIESLYAFLETSDFIKESELISLKAWYGEEVYDSDAIRDDLTENVQESNTMKQIKSYMQNNGGSNNKRLLKIVQNIQNYMQNTTDSQCSFHDIMSRRIFNSIHTYFTHSKDELYRTKSKLDISQNRFSTQVQTKNNKNKNKNNNNNIYEIDFGLNILQWLAYGILPTFNNLKDEMVNNPESTISVPLYSEYEEECKILCDVIDIDINLEEMMSLKLYVDTTRFQSALRRAFWLKGDLQQKQNFYFWGSTLYRCFLRFSTPTSSKKLYHGLNQVFVIESSLPQYNGIFSTSSDENVANKFSENQGIRWQIVPSHSNPFKIVVGISSHWFTSFKNEKEFIIFNSFIPIHSVTNFATTKQEKIDILVKQSTTYNQQIIDKKAFFRNIGITQQEVEDNLLDEIVKNKHIYFKTTEYNGYSVLHRLCNELGLFSDFAIGHILRRKHDPMISVLLMELDEDDEQFVDDFKECEYIVNDDKISKYKYNDVIPIRNRTVTNQCFVRNKKIFGIDQYVLISSYQPSAFNDIPFITLTKHNQSPITSNKSIQIDHKINVTKWDKESKEDGVFQIYSANIIIIEEDGHIYGHDCGYSFGFGIGRGQRVKGDGDDKWYEGGGGYGCNGCSYKGANGGISYGKKTLHQLFLGSPSGYNHGYNGGGGIIEIIAKTVINLGVISCDGWYGGSGGSIKIKCKQFINEGTITAKGGKGSSYYRMVGSGGYGRIMIESEKYRNKGRISPLPFIQNALYVHQNTVHFTVIADAEKGTDNDHNKMDETKETELFDDNELIKVNQDSFYHIFDDPHSSIYKYRVEGSLIINSTLNIPKWKEDQNGSGFIQIYCSHSLIIQKKGIIDANGAGYDYPFGVGRGDRIKGVHGGGGYGTKGESKGIAKGGAVYGDRALKTLFFGSPSGDGESRSGGVIELIAETITNYGSITCYGGYGASGGSIKIRCRRLINNGSITAKGDEGDDKYNIGAGGDGRIAIYCEYMENKEDDSISPKAFVSNKEYKYVEDHFEFTAIDTSHHENAAITK